MFKMKNHIFVVIISLLFVQDVLYATETDTPPNSSDISFPICLSGIGQFDFKVSESIDTFSDEVIKQLDQQSVLNNYPNTKIINCRMPCISNTKSAADYYTNNNTKDYFDNFHRLEKLGLEPMKMPTYGFLTLPADKERFACAILCHGSEGFTHEYLKVANSLAANGIASFIFNRFFLVACKDKNGNASMVQSTSEDQFLVSLEDEVLKTIGAIKLLQSHPKINASEIGLIGWSRGGNVALECSLQGTLNKVFPAFKPKFCVNYYTMPVCQKREAPVCPTLFVHGANDNLTPVKHLFSYLDKIVGNNNLKMVQETTMVKKYEVNLKKNQINALIYKNAGHAFDADFNLDDLISSQDVEEFFEIAVMLFRSNWAELIGDSFKEMKPGFMNLSDCCVEPHEDGTGFKGLVDKQQYTWAQLPQFLQKNTKFGVTLEYNPQAGIEAWNSVLDFLNQVLTDNK